MSLNKHYFINFKAYKEIQNFVNRYCNLTKKLEVPLKQPKIHCLY